MVPYGGDSGSGNRASTAASSLRGALRSAGLSVRGSGPKSGSDDRATTKRKRARRRNLIIAGTAMLLMVAGIGLVGVTYYFDDVQLPQSLDGNLKQSTTLTYADGTEMARLGDETRTIVSIDAISKPAQYAVVAAEDNTFYSNDGVDYKITRHFLLFIVS